MKRKNSKRKIFSYLVIWSVIISSLLLYSPERHVVSAAGVPEINLNTPIEGAAIDKPTVEFTGTIADDTTAPEKILVNVFEQQSKTGQPIEITSEGKLTISPQDKNAGFSFIKDFTEGTHTLTFIATDGDGTSNKIERSFTVNPAETGQANVTTPPTTNVAEKTVQSSTGTVSMAATIAMTDTSVDATGKRPYLAKMYLIPKDSENDYVPGAEEPKTFLLAEDMTRVPLGYKILLDIRSTEPLTSTQPLLTSFGDIKGQEKLVKTTALTDNLTSYVYTFTPEKDFSLGATYYVYLNPQFSSESGIGIIPRFIKFTTVSDNYDKYQFENSKGNVNRDKDYIHGPFSVVTNACNFCHSTHNGNNEFLESGKNGSTGNELCMACHDGTNGSPKIENNYAESKHFKDSSVSCSNCHDPHNPGTKDNPNSLNPVDSGKLPDSNTNPILTYKKAGTATGAVEDFSLCLNCHNGTKVDTKTGKSISNIGQYYKDSTYTGQSGHRIVATDDSGSALNGQLPCAECHETHGSGNIKMLRQELGNTQSADNHFIKISGDWDSTSQRDFCTACHNDKTVLYGKTAVSIYDETGTALNTTNEQTKIGHNQNSDQACSECHSNNNSFIEAAHAPK